MVKAPFVLSDFILYSAFSHFFHSLNAIKGDVVIKNSVTGSLDNINSDFTFTCLVRCNDSSVPSLSSRSCEVELFFRRASVTTASFFNPAFCISINGEVVDSFPVLFHPLSKQNLLFSRNCKFVCIPTNVDSDYFKRLSNAFGQAFTALNSVSSNTPFDSS